MDDETYLKRIRWYIKRWETWLYCSKCMYMIGRFHKRQYDNDFWRPSDCHCPDPIAFDLELSDVRDFYKPKLDFIKDRDYETPHLQTQEDINRAKALRRWNSSKSRWE